MTGAWLETEEDVIESRADLRNRLGSVLERGDLPEERREEVMNALRVGERPIREVMIPAEDVVTLSAEAEPEENFLRMEQHPHTRYPLVGNGMGDYRGIVYFPMLARYREPLAHGEIDLESVAAPPMTLPADARVSDAIDRFQAEHQELALVTEDGDVVGMATVTDLLEVVTGDVRDPVDRKSVAAAEDD